MKTRVLAWVYIVGISFVLFYYNNGVAHASCPSHEFPEGTGYSWRYPLNVIIIDDTQTFENAINNSQSDYHNNTDLALADGPTTHFGGNYHNLRTIEGNYGAVGWYGIAIAFSNMVPCASFTATTATGLCGTTEETSADYAIAYVNSFETASFNNRCRNVDPNDCVSLREKVIRHEWGHVFGMAHNECDSPSVMVPSAYWLSGMCEFFNDSLTDADKNIINCWY